MNAQTKIEGVAIDADLLAKADALGIDVARVCERALYMAMRRAPDPRLPEEKRAAGEKWAEDNREAMEAWNVWVEEHGLPLARYRLF